MIDSVLAIDPGERAGFAWIGGIPVLRKALGASWAFPQVWDLWTDPAKSVVTPRATVVEYQYANPKIKRTNLIKLSFRAGFLLREHCGFSRTFAMAPLEWKGKLFRNGASVKKEIFCNRIEALLLPAERVLLDEVKTAHRLDCLDAIGLAWVFWGVKPKEPFEVHIEKGRLNVR